MPRFPSYTHERQFWQQGIALIAGIDEVGMGALAGPVVAAAVILREDIKIVGIRDSKMLTALQRENLAEEIK